MSSALLLSLLLVGVEPDPRIQLVVLQARQESHDALARTERLLVERPTWSRDNGLDYLRGHLFEKLDRPRDATRAYAEAARSSPVLEAKALVRIAVNQIGLGHPEMAAGILASSLRRPTSERTADAAALLLVKTLPRGGDCTVLSRIDVEGLSPNLRRRIAVSRIDCDIRAGRRSEAAPSLIRLVTENETDLAAKNAADRLLTLLATPRDPTLRITLSAVFYQHRDFEQAALLLEPVADSFASRLGSRDYELYYRLARSYFWTGKLLRAVEIYDDLAERGPRDEDRAKASYQMGRCYELLGRWAEASTSYRQAFVTEQRGNFSGASLLAALRVEWREGREERSADILETFPNDRLWRREYSRALLFLASSDIVRRRDDRAGDWLRQARALAIDPIETAYWSGRLEELHNDPETAVRRYVEAARRDLYHPLVLSALKRLESPALAPAALATAKRLASSSRTRDLVVGRRILGPTAPEAGQALRRLEEKLSSSRASRAFLSLAPVPPAAWPLWQQPHDDPEEKLLALGLWGEADPVVLKHFPLSNLPLAYTAGLNLAATGRTNRALYIAEILNRSLPSDFPASMLPADYRRLLYPIAYEDDLRAASSRFDVDPNLMLAIFRQESRFDPAATSPASARGLAQFIYPTAAAIGKRIGHWPLTPEDLEDPSIAIVLSAAHLSELGREFHGIPHRVAAAYNAGERQAALWGTYCYSREADEYYSKVSFAETRNYLDNVLRNRAHYREIYGNHWSRSPP